MKRIFILGSTGFIGKRLSKLFQQEDQYRITCFSSKECDLLSWEEVCKAFSSITSEDVIIFASCITRQRDDSLKALIRNIQMATNISRLIEEKSLAQLLFLSTVEVYGLVPPGKIISEEQSLHPVTYYATAKLASEFMLKKSCSRMNVPLFIIRLPGVYGKGDDEISTVSKFACAALNGKITIFGEGKDKRDFILVDDLHKIIKAAIENKTSTTMNIATGESYPMKEIAQMIVTAGKLSCPIEYSLKEGNFYDLRYDVSLFKEYFPEIRLTSLKEGITIYMKDHTNSKIKKFD